MWKDKAITYIILYLVFFLSLFTDRAFSLTVKAKLKPDLILTSATFSNPSPKPGETVTINITIKNQGESSLNDSISVGAKPDDGSPAVSYSTKNLNRDETRNISLKYTVPSDTGGKNICFRVSVSSKAEPSDKVNNNDLSQDPCLSVQMPVAESPKKITTLSRRITPDTGSDGRGLNNDMEGQSDSRGLGDGPVESSDRFDKKAGSSTPSIPTRAYVTLGEGPSRGMELAELKSTMEITKTDSFVPNRIILLAFPLGNVRAQQILKAISKKHHLSLIEMAELKSIDGVMGVYKIIGRREVMDVIDKIRQEGQVIAQPNYYYKTLGSSIRNNLLYGPDMIEINRLGGKATGKGVRVAILDTGVDSTHKDLNGKLALYKDIVDYKSKPSPDLHGTAIAGIIAGIRSEERGGAGIAPGSSLVIIKVIEPKSVNSLEGTSTTDKIIKGLDVAINSGARVINLSIGGPEDESVGRMIDGALKKGIVVVAAGGNDGPRGSPPYPATHPGVIAVTAIDSTWRPYPLATQGDFIFISAPGVDIFTTAPDNTYRLVSGTSFSAAHVSGFVALLLELEPSLSPEKVMSAFKSGAIDIEPPGKDPVTGYGCLSACRAIQASFKKNLCD